ncbi:unnamed protein product [Rhizophagus irregularis]|nr:unnamed protein product [Rhizophagus irregularis]
MYGRDAVLPVDFAVKTMQAELHEGDSQDDLLARIRMLTGRVTEDRLMTQDAIYEAQQQQKQRHDENLYGTLSKHFRRFTTNNSS